MYGRPARKVIPERKRRNPAVTTAHLRDACGYFHALHFKRNWIPGA
jgi:hypothetical protein